MMQLLAKNIVVSELLYAHLLELNIMAGSVSTVLSNDVKWRCRCHGLGMDSQLTVHFNASQQCLLACVQGHTDGHLALLHRITGTLLVGDHCVG